MTQTNTKPLLLLSLVGLAAVVLASWAGPAAAAGCTYGVDCFCDTYTAANDPQLKFCEDFENPAYYLNVAHNWAAGSGGNRGSDSAYFKKWGNGETNALFKNTDPAPRIGSACGFSACVGAREYCSTAQGNLADGRGADCWGPDANALSELDVQRSGDYNADISDNVMTGGRGITPDIGAGLQSMAYRVPAGKAYGGNNIINWSCGGGHCTELGITQLMAYPTNVGRSNIWTAPWKHDEFGTQYNGGSFWWAGNTGAGGSAQLPYRPFLWSTSCSAVESTAVVHRGLLGCNTEVAVIYAADPNYYDQARDFPWGTWHCVRAHIKGLGTSNGEIHIWHDETEIVNITNLNFNYLGAKYLDDMRLDFYPNANQGLGEGTRTAETTYRYQDNLVIRNGPPASCAAIGFGGTSASSTPPPASPVVLP